MDAYVFALDAAFMDSLDEKPNPQADIGSAFVGVLLRLMLEHRAESRSRPVRLYSSVLLQVGWWCVEIVRSLKVRVFYANEL